jgi:signal recognition particle receptor subunit beta
MTFVNYAAREINCKIVYYGPGLGGKTTNIQYIYEKTNPDAKGKLITFLPLELGKIRGFSTRFHLYTVPGQVFYEASRKLILKGADGVVFVADSQTERMDANVESLRDLVKQESLRDLVKHLREYGYDLKAMPYVLQFNKRDLPNISSEEEMLQKLHYKGEPHFSASAVKGPGVFETLKAVVKQVLLKLKGST